MQVTPEDAEAMCPVCSGQGFNTLPVTSQVIECRLCAGDGFLDDPAERRAFWKCAGTKNVAWCVEATVAARMPKAA